MEIMSDSSNGETGTSSMDNNNESQQNEYVPQTTGVHFLTEKPQEDMNNDFDASREKEQDKVKESARVKNEGVEYIIRGDGSVVCKLCGEILQSRTHWYRHKYRLHAPPSLNPAPLFQCEQCLLFFKSRKGYIGHIASRHSEVLADTSPVLTNAQVEAMAKEHKQPQHQHLQALLMQQDFKDELDPEMAIPKSSVLNYQAPAPKQTPAKPPEPKKLQRNTRAQGESSQSGPEKEEKRIREEKLVTDIIDRVRRECEAQGSWGPARRNYNRRNTVMHAERLAQQAP